MRSAFLSLILFTGFLFAQSSVYEDAYRAAMEDGKVSEDEHKILVSLQKNLGLDEDEVLEIQRQVTGTTGPSTAVSRAGRRLVIAQNMSYGNGLYGWGLPYVLGVESSTVYAGMQLLSFAGGFYLTWQYTKDMDIPTGRAAFQNAGSLLGLASIYPLMTTVGFEKWGQFDPDAKIALTYAMVSVPVGIMAADRLYQRWRPTDGQATAVIGVGALGSIHGFIGHLLATPEDTIINPDNWLRLNSLLTYGGFLGGGYLGWQLFSHELFTTGDAAFISLGALLGFFTGVQLIALADLEFKPGLLTLLVFTDAVTYAAYHLGKGYDLTSGEAGIVSLGSFAAWAAYRGLTLVMDIDQSQKGLQLGDIISYLGGAYFTFRFIDPQREIAATRRGAVQLSLHPRVWPIDGRMVPGISAGVSF